MSKNYRTSKSYILRNIAGQNVLVSIGDGVADFSGVITLNDTAAFAWTCLEGGADLAKLTDAVTEEYEVSRETAEADMAELLELLESRRMVIVD